MRTEETLEALEAALTGNCGDFYGACKEVGVSPAFVKRWQGDDPKVEERVKNASEVGALGLEHEAIRRAVHGVKERIYYKGVKVGSKQNYSDSLLQTLLKKRIKTVYGDDPNTTNVNINQQIAIVPRANSYEEWLEMARLTENRQLPAPAEDLLSDAIDAEFTTVLPSPELDPAMADIL